MPGAVTPIHVRRTGTYVLLEAALPGQAPRPIGVLLIDPATDRAFFKLRPSFDGIAAPDDAEVLDALGPHIQDCVSEMGAEAFLQSLEDSASNTIRVTDRQSVEVDAFTRVLAQLFSEHVEPVPIEPFRTHLPLYSLRAAAG